MLSAAKTLGKVAGCIVLYLVGFDIAGVVACLILDVLSFGDSNTVGYYVLWAVLGIFCGLFSYDSVGKILSPKSKPDGPGQGETNQDWTSREDSGRTGLLVILATAAVLATLWVPCLLVGTWHSVEPSGFVPDNAPLTLTFFTAVFASTVFAHTSLRPKPKK